MNKLDQSNEKNHIRLYGIFKNPLKWFIDLPIRAWLLFTIALILPFGFLIVMLIALFAEIKNKETISN